MVWLVVVGAPNPKQAAPAGVPPPHRTAQLLLARRGQLGDRRDRTRVAAADAGGGGDGGGAGRHGALGGVQEPVAR